MIPESETNLGGTGNVAFFSSSHELNYPNLKKTSVVDAEENLIVAKKDRGHMEISQKELNVVCRGQGRIDSDYYNRMPFQLGPFGQLHTGAVALIFMVVPACTFMLLFALSWTLRVLLFWY